MLNVQYGGGVVRLGQADHAEVTVLQPQRFAPLVDMKAAFAVAAVRGVASLPLHMQVRPFDCVTLLAPPEELMRQDNLLVAIVNYLTEIGIPHANMTILTICRPSALGAPASVPRLFGDIRVLQHDPDATDLVTLGMTENKTPVQVNPLLAGRNRVIVVGGVRTDALLGFTGGAECLLAACSRETQEGCMRFALHAGQSLLQSFAPGASITPLGQEMRAVGRLVQPLFAVCLAMDGHGVPVQMTGGRWEEAWNCSCLEALRVGSLPLPQRAEIVIASAGGSPWDASLDGAVRGLLSAAGSLSPGGEMLFFAECKDASALEGCLAAHQANTLQDQMLEHPTFTALYFAALLQVSGQHTVLMQSKINTQTLAAMGIRGFRTSETMEAALSWAGRRACYLPDSLTTTTVSAG